MGLIANDYVSGQAPSTWKVIDNPFGTVDGQSKSEIVANVGSNVDMYTGKANITIPLHVIKVEGLNIPITISYQTGGIKVTDVTGTAGLGWNFSSGAKISRNMSGSRGDMDEGLDDLSTQNDDSSAGYIKAGGDSETAMNQRIEHLKLQSGWDKDRQKSPLLIRWEIDFNRRDTRPDMCHFEIPGAQGMFMFGWHGQTHTIPYQNVKIEYLDFDGQLPFKGQDSKRIKVTDSNGYEYYFGAIIDENGVLDESGLEYIQIRDNNIYAEDRVPLEGTKPLHQYSTIGTWHLRKIVKDGRVIATYSYNSYTSYGIGQWNCLRTFRYKGTTPPSLQSETIFVDEPHFPLSTLRNGMTILSPKYLKSIKTEHEKIEFTYTGSGKKRLAKMEISYNNDKVKTIELDYGVFETPTWKHYYADSFDYSPPKLKGIKEQIKDAAVKTVCTFDYEDFVEVVPENTGGYGYVVYFNSFDHWNYYNGAPNATDLALVRIFPGFSVLDSLTGTRYTYAGADRNPNFEYAKARSLTRIRYNGGGYREFEYEPHVASDGRIAGGLRIKSIKECDKTGKVASKVRYEYNDIQTGRSSGRMFADPEATTAVMSMRDGSHIKFRVYLRNIYQLEDYNGAAIVYPNAQEIYTNGGYKNVTFYSFDDFKDEKAKVISIFNGETNDPARRDYRMAPYTSYWWARGMVKSTEIYNASNELEARENFVYELEPEPRKKLIDRVPFTVLSDQLSVVKDNNIKAVFFPRISESYWISQAIQLKSHTIEIGKKNLGNETHYTYHPKYNVPIYSIVTNDNGDIIETFIRYPFDLGFTSDDPIDVYDPECFRELFRRNLHVAIETYVKKNGKVISAQLMTFKKVKALNNTEEIKLHKTYGIVIDNPISDFMPARYSEYLRYDSRYVLSQTIDHYDLRGNATSICIPRTGDRASLIYDKFGNKIAEILLLYRI